MFDAWILDNGETVQAVLFFTLLAVFTVVERLAPARPRDRSHRSRWLANLSLTAVNVVVMSALPVSFLGASLWAGERQVGLLRQASLPFAVAVAAHLLGRGFISFVSHYLMHRVPVLWRLHRVHHLDTQMDVSTTVRFHPLEFAVNLALGVPLVVTLGLSPVWLLAYELLDAAVTLVSHANVHLPSGVERWLRYLIVTPDLHRVHHSSLQRETDSNFGAVFPLWDLIFGTFRTASRERQASMVLGLDEVRDHRTHRVGWLLFSPFRRLSSRAAPGADHGSSAGAAT